MMHGLVYFRLFFFSSRRRHTRFKCDWSSDVCSSDLASILTNPWIRIIGGVVIIAFGLQLIGLLKISALYKDTRQFSQEKPRGMLGSFTLGIAFAAGWTPCIGPILGGIIGLAATSGGWRSGL